jgi:site-specific recombinase XerD
MATINFYLDKPDRKDKRPIILTYLLNGKKFRFSTRLKTTEKAWDSQKQRIKRNADSESTINYSLKEFIHVIELAEHNAKLGHYKLTLDTIRAKLLEHVGKIDGVKDLFQVFEEYIEVAKSTKTPNTVKGYTTCLQKLKEFNITKKYILNFESIDSTFYEKFVQFLMNDCNLVNNSTGKYIKIMKSFMTYATDKGFNKSYDFKKFKVLEDDADIIYLTEEQLFKLYQLPNLPERLATVRDAFCLGCFTGLRFSDLSNLKLSNIKDGYIELKTIKTRDHLRIPLNNYAKAIIDKYEGKIPRMISNQKMNDYLKELGQLAEINEEILLTKYKGTLKIETIEPKYNFLTTHTARRTFVTLSLEKGMRPEIVMSITGHKDYSTFKKYIKLTESVKLAEMNSAWN